MAQSKGGHCYYLYVLCQILNNPFINSVPQMFPRETDVFSNGKTGERQIMEGPQSVICSRKRARLLVTTARLYIPIEPVLNLRQQHRSSRF